MAHHGLFDSKNYLSTLNKTIVSVSEKLAYRKSQRNFLNSVQELDLCSSIRPKIGKVFSDPELEDLKNQYLDDCRLKIARISLEEANNDIIVLKQEFRNLFISCQNNLSQSEYLNLSRLAKSTENRILFSQKVKHENKIKRHVNAINIDNQVIQERLACKPEKSVKHNQTLQHKKLMRNRKRRLKCKLIRNANLAAKVTLVKSSGVVINLTDIEVPDGAFLYLSKGNSFVPAVPASKHDIIFDTNEFLRKLSWRTFFNIHERGLSDSNSNVHPKLKLKSRKWPAIQNKLLDNVSSKIRTFTDSINISANGKHTNLTYIEKKGLQWCIQMKNSNKVHFSQADKGGATVLMDPTVVHYIISSELENAEKYFHLSGDPRSNIEKSLLQICQDGCNHNGLNESELFLITGHTGNGGKSHNPSFKAGKPNPFPLFKLHSLTHDEIVDKVIPPHRLVTSMKFGPTKRSALFIDSILTPVSISYCGTEYLKDTPDFLKKILSFEAELCSTGVNLFSLDVKALYPSINPIHLPVAIETALGVVTNFSPDRIQFIVNLVKFNVSNAVTHYRGDWFKVLVGLPTGASDSVCLANIYMRWVLLNFFLTHPVHKKFIVKMWRFIDDLFGGWGGTIRQFRTFINCLNDYGKKFGILFDKEQFGDTINFLDVTVSNCTGVLITDIYHKPTDAHRYLHHNSFHPKHTFSGIPFSQMRRAVLICSNDYLRDIAINDMITYFLKCGYNNDLLLQAKTRALTLNRPTLLVNHGQINNKIKKSNALCFVLPYSVEISEIKHFINSLADDIKSLTGIDEIIFSYKRNPNTSSMLFNKYGFAQKKQVLESQKCGRSNCSSCDLKFPTNGPIKLLHNFTVKPSTNADCKTDNVIYTAICKNCFDFYFGKTMTEEHIRMNGHREKFCIDKFDESALSKHIYVDHPDKIGNCPEDGLSNYNVAIIESVNAPVLDRRESFYIWSTEADIRHLNRYKAMR